MMENEGYEEEQTQLDVAASGRPSQGEVASRIESFHGSAEGHVYEDILVSAVSGNAGAELSQCDTCNENVSVELPLPMVGGLLQSSQRATAFTGANSRSDSPPAGNVAATWPNTPAITQLPCRLEDDRGSILELGSHWLTGPPTHTTAASSCSCGEDRHDSDCERRNAEIGLKSVEFHGLQEPPAPPRQPTTRRRRKKDCKHCRHRVTEQLSPRRQDPISTIESTIQQDLERTNTPESFHAPKTKSVGLLVLPAFHQINEERKAGRDADGFLTSVNHDFHSLDKSANYPTHSISSEMKMTGSMLASPSPTYQSKPAASMRVNSIYSQDRSYSKDSRIFFTDLQDSCAFKRAYSFPTRVQSPVVQNRVNLRRSVRGEPPPEPARLSKDRHGWTLHFVKPLKRRPCSRALVALILLIIGLLGIGSIALYIMCEPERLRIIQQYLKSSTNSSISRATHQEEINISTTTPMVPVTTLGGAETRVDVLLNVGGPLFAVTSSTRDASMNVVQQVESVESPRDNFTRYCDDCLAGEVCVALISEEVPICRRVTDQDDPTGCGGLCIVNKQRCHRLDIDAFRCLDVEHSCLEDEWSCSNALCIPLEKRCDGHMNCYDHSDEDNCICNFETHFQCGNETSCLPLDKRCDNKIDCWDAADEINCTLGRNLSRSCPMDNQFTCTDGECVLKTRFCDGLADCADGSDEPDGCEGRCNKYEFTCGNSRCIAKAMKCNGWDDCGDGSDERHCKSRQI